MSRITAFLVAWRLPVLLTTLCVGLAVALAGVVGTPIEQPGGSSQQSESAGGDPAAERSFELEPLSNFEAVADRPLFSRSRRPLPQDRGATGDAKSGNGGAPFLLSGVIVAGATRVAFLQPRSQPKTLRVLEGETVEGWKIEKILPQRVVVGNGSVRQELSLQDRIAPVSAPGAARPPGKDGGPIAAGTGTDGAGPTVPGRGRN